LGIGGGYGLCLYRDGPGVAIYSPRNLRRYRVLSFSAGIPYPTPTPSFLLSRASLIPLRRTPRIPYPAPVRTRNRHPYWNLEVGCLLGQLGRTNPASSPDLRAS